MATRIRPFVRSESVQTPPSALGFTSRCSHTCSRDSPYDSAAGTLTLTFDTLLPETFRPTAIASTGISADRSPWVNEAVANSGKPTRRRRLTRVLVTSSGPAHWFGSAAPVYTFDFASRGWGYSIFAPAS